MIARSWPVTNDGCTARFNDVADGAQCVAEIFGVIFLVTTTKQRNQFAVDALKAVNEQVKILEPIVLSQAVKQTVKYTPGEFDPATDKYPDVQAALFRNPEGGFILLAANSTYYPIDTTFGVSFLGSKGKAGRLFSGARLDIKDGKFSERLERCAVRAYCLDGPEPLADAVAISVTMQAHPELSTQDKVEIPRSGRVGA